MKIGIITSPFGPLPPNALGAVEKRWYYIAKEFNRNGHHVTFYAKADNSYDKEREVDIIPVNGYLRTKSIYLDIILDFIYTVKAYHKLKPCDILIQNTFWAPVLGILYKSKYRKSIYNVARKPARHFKLYRAVDQFSCVSQSVQEDLNNYIDDHSKGTTVSNPVNLDYFSYSKRIPSDTDVVSICYHGRVHPEKGLDILSKALQLISSHHHFKLTIIGPYDVEKGGGGIGYTEYLKSLAPNVEILFTGPFSSPERLNRMLHENYLYCYPSTASGETFGVSPLEAMATGACVIVSGLNCFKDFIRDGETGFIFDHRSDKPEYELSKIIMKLLNDPSLVERIGENAREESKLFSVSNIAKRYLHNFKTLLNQNE